MSEAYRHAEAGGNAAQFVVHQRKEAFCDSRISEKQFFDQLDEMDRSAVADTGVIIMNC
jgi:hypothetical protein